ncbi:hypothetical protein [Litorisediminicola beolgyonensis]|uniref:Uncharacterized protein n=1 Tax=Litorisediminicola beolgyonensis TaxID=1173614 RepID=A0ABW3ZJG6_9RHOB
MHHVKCALAALATVAAGPVTAACFGPGTDLFHCTTTKGEKALDICLQDAVAYYRFGAVSGPAELLLADAATDVAMAPWPGIGRTIWEELTFANGHYSYTVHYGIERTPDAPPPMGGVIVRKGDEVIASVDCDPGSLTSHDFYPLFQAKEAAGQVWCRDDGTWRAGCD